MSLLERLIPREANNEYRGSRIALYTFSVLSTVMLIRSLIHFLKDDSGVNSIATIVTFSGSPDPNQVIYMFSSLWGTQQLITVLVYAVVLLRYRNLVPLMYTLLIVEICLRMIVGSIHPLSEDFYVRTPPGKLGNIPLLTVSAIMLFLSLRGARRERSEAETASGSP
jgi:hypothetical protein